MTENGYCVKNEDDIAPADAIHDADRIEYYQEYANALLAAATEDGADIRGYFGWSEYVRASAVKMLICYNRLVGQF